MALRRPAAWRIAIAAACVLLAAAQARRFRYGGAPYFEVPATVIDHVGPRTHEIRTALGAVQQLAVRIPPAASLTCFRPAGNAIPDDTADYFATLFLLPALRVLPPASAASGNAEYVIAIDQPFVDARYTLVDQCGSARLYGLRR